MDWDKLRIFHAVASAGSFTHAGQMLTLSQSAVSRQISALEEEITTPLFQRHARGLTLTDEGEMLYAAVSDVLTRLAQAEEALKNVREVAARHAQGHLQPRHRHLLARAAPRRLPQGISGSRSPSGDGRSRTRSGAARGRSRHPHACAGAGRPHPAQALHGALSHVRDEDVSGRNAARRRRSTILPITPSSPMARRLRRRSAKSTGCSNRRGARLSGKGRTVRINNVTGILCATEASVGIAAVPDYVAAERPHLMRVLPDVPGPSFDVHLVYADALRQSKRVAAFRDFLVRASKEWRY